jgi:tight adherence protein C
MALAILAAFGMGGLGGFLVAMGSLVLGLIGPRKVLDIKAADRREAVAAALPGAIDLLTTCIDASLSLERALARVAREIAPTSPVLAAELSVTARELEAGVPLADGLRRLSRRVGLDDLSALCGVLAQAHGLGAPIGNTLRDFAASSRRARMGMLEERAGKLAAQMTLPLAACLLPAAMLIILGPAALQLVRALH